MKAFTKICFLFLLVQLAYSQARSAPEGANLEIFHVGNTLNYYQATSKLPTATLEGDREICEGQTAVLTVTLTGKHPWEINVSDGSSILKFSGIESSPFTFDVSPNTTTTYTIVSVLDSRGTINSGEGAATVTVYPNPEVVISRLKTSYNVEEDPVPLAAEPPGGSFSGKGVTGPPWYFDPGLAGSQDSPHLVTYDYSNEYGCPGSDSALVYVLSAQGNITIPRETYCSNNKPFRVSATNVTGTTGSFKLINASGSAVAGLTDNGDNTALVDPGILGQGSYTILYQYIQMATTLSLQKSFFVEAVQLPLITKPVQNTFCQNESEMDLDSDIPTAVFSGPGVTGTVDQGFTFNPVEAYPGENILTCTFTTESGCVSSTTKIININPVPALGFSTDKTCVGAGDTVYFNNTTNNSIITGWEWDFGDPQSGDFNYSTLPSPWHVYTTSGFTGITLSGITEDGCEATLSKNVILTPRPTGTFTAMNDCYSDGRPTLFQSQVEPSSSISKYRWTFYVPGAEPEIIEGDRETSYMLNGTGTYNVELFAESEPGCSTTIFKSIYLKPTIELTDHSYLENFENGNGGWLPVGEIEGTEKTWSQGVPEYANTPDYHSSSWYISPDSVIPGFQSYLASPCFNLDGLNRPMIKLNIFRKLQNDNEGVVLQSSTDNLNWITIGTVDDGINWYNSTNVSSKPGGQETAWTGSSMSWTDARHDLEQVSGSKEVRFRLAYARDAMAENGTGSFALNRVEIGKRTQNVLLEHFTNGSDDLCRSVNTLVNTIYGEKYRDMVKLEYHTDFPGYDPFFEQNPSVVATRTLYYGITSVPSSILGGGRTEDDIFDYSNSHDLNGNDIAKKSLTDPAFDIRLKVSRDRQTITADVTITSMRDNPPGERILQVAVFEKNISDVTTGNGEKTFINVVKTLLPNAAGTAIFDGWAKYESRNYVFSWNYENVYDQGMIRMAAFLQNDSDGEVYQVASDDTTGLYTTAGNTLSRMTGMTLYPNPASAELNVSFENTDNDNYRVEIYDQTGRFIKSVDWNKGDRVMTIDLSGMNAGIYYVTLKNKSGSYVEYGKLVIVK